MTQWSDELHQKHTVMVDGGSGVLIQPMTDQYTYVLTAKHNVLVDNDDANSDLKLSASISIKGFNNNSLNVLSVIPDQDIDIAIILIEYQEIFSIYIFNEILTNGDQVKLCGYPMDRRSHEKLAKDQYSSYTFEMHEYVNETLILSNNDVASHDNIVGFSGGGIFTLDDDKNIFLCGIEIRMDGNPDQEIHGRVIGIPISKFENLIKDETYLGEPLATLKEVSSWLFSNIQWLNDAFSNRMQARIKLGQPLSPADTDITRIQQRKSLIEEIHSYITIRDKNVVVIHGGEGHGKSWIIAQSWLALENKPLMVFMTSEDFVDVGEQNEIIELLISKIIMQTGEQDTLITQKYWHKRLKQWQNQSTIIHPRLLVIIDAINQRQQLDWARNIESFSSELSLIGGHLIVTSRTPYFHDYVKNRLTAQISEIIIPEWTESERNEILTMKGIKASELHLDVARSLCNPRLLGIALELLDKADITCFDELSTSRLLFEHMRISERDSQIPQPAHQFAHKLQKHAKNIIARVNENQHNDLLVFEDEIGDVADGRFFQTLDGEPMRYSLKDEGLTLALGFSIIDKLRTAQRNSCDLDVELSAILEPVSALDDTANVILASLTVAILDDKDNQQVIAAIVKGFSMLQNPDSSKFPAFVSLAKVRVQGFMDAACSLSLMETNQPNYDWIKEALIRVGENTLIWEKMVKEVHLWLSSYSLSIDQNIYSRPSGNSQNKIQDKQKKLQEKVQALSDKEQKILECSTERQGNLSKLSGLAIFLLVGKPLTPFAESLIKWSFSYALNSCHSYSYNNFMNLVMLNKIDWLETRSALLHFSSELCEPEVSKIGKWTLATLLYATGDSDDAKKAQSLVEILTKDREKKEGWRLIEEYCSIDPCDPLSEQPNNIIQTSKKYSEIDVSKIDQLRGRSSEDLFINMASTGIARFKAGVAVEKYRELINDVIKRRGFPLYQGMFELIKHRMLLTEENISQLVKKWKEINNEKIAYDLDGSDIWLVSQYLLLLSFPSLNASVQIQILLSNEKDENPLTELIEIVKTPDNSEFEDLLDSACIEKNEYKQFILLAIASITSVQLSIDSVSNITLLFHSKSERVRSQALAVIAKEDNRELLKLVVESDWSAAGTKEIDDYEKWYGSLVLFKAATKGLILHGEMLNRISEKFYSSAISMLDNQVTYEVIQRIDISINKALELDIIPPDIEVQICQLALDKPDIYSIEGKLQDNDLMGRLKRSSESRELFEQRQKANHQAFEHFKAKITRAKAMIIFENMTLKEFSSIILIDKNLADQWYDKLMKASDSTLLLVHSFVLKLAYALAKEAPEKSEKLFTLVKDNKPMIMSVSGINSLGLDLRALWSVARSPVLDALRFSRLDKAGSDYQLSLEVLAALLNGQQDLLLEYITIKLKHEEPAEISRGLMVVGFSDQSELYDNILKKYDSVSGLIGSAHKAAKYVYERNLWAQHWYGLMCKENDKVELWRYTLLFSKIVDGRFELWQSKYEQKNNPVQSFGSVVEVSVKKRIERWKYHRDKKLFGLDAPSSIFF